MAKQKIKVEIPEQGISISLTPDEADNFFEKEIEFYQEMQPLLQQPLSLGGNRLASYGHIATAALKIINAARRDLGHENNQSFDDFVQSAKDYVLVVGQGHIGQHIKKLISSNHLSQAQWLLVVFSHRGEKDSWINPFRAMAIGNPSMLAFGDLSYSASALEKSNQARAQISTAQKKLEGFIAKKTELFDELETLYREKLVIDEPAISWQKVSTAKTTAWRLWLGFFAILVVLPIIGIISFWPEFSGAIVKLASGNNGNFSLSGVAAISVPALLYAWLLKNVSRVFLQNLNLADDAAHRRTLAVTYLGLAENPKLKVPETERAIILNALFRPIPLHGGDEGPPAGLVELIKGRS